MNRDEAREAARMKYLSEFKPDVTEEGLRMTLARANAFDAGYDAGREDVASALRELMKALPSELHCHELHHPKKDQHGLTADCPVEERYKQALASAERLLNGGGE